MTNFYNDKPTFLKFDIEGAELDALKGAKNTITAFKPKLAVCIYHLPDDLWTIPLYIKEEFSFYNLYVRTHQYDGFRFCFICYSQVIKSDEKNTTFI